MKEEMETRLDNQRPAAGSADAAGLAAQRELEIGRRIQASFLPKVIPQPPGWEIACRFEAARVVAGDFYDVFALSGGKRVGLVIADVCDKGVGAALFMALFRSLIRAFADQHYALGWMDVLAGDSLSSTSGNRVGRRRELLSTGTTALKNAIDLTNKYIVTNHGDSNMFATMFFGVLDPTTGQLMYINGGHEPPVLVGSHGIKTRLEITGPAVGLWPDMQFGIEQIEIEPGDILFAFTDGAMDVRDSQGESFGEEQLLSLVHQSAPSAADLLERVMTNLNHHMAGTGQFDDITLLAVRRT